MARRGRLVRRLLVATGVPAVAVLGLFGALAHEVARASLEDAIGRRLATAAAGVALLVLPEQLQAIGAGDEGSATYANLRKGLARAKEQLGVRRALLVAGDLTGRGDTENLVALGAPAHELGADRDELARAAAGAPTASPLFWEGGVPYKRGYARVGSAGWAVVEGSADSIAALAGLRRQLLLGAASGAALIVLLSVLAAARITGPLARLAAAAERIGRGDLGAAVPVETRDEIGQLAVRLDEMRSALAARDERLQMMLAGIAHEVRNPLGGLELYAGLLREGLAGTPERLAEVIRIEREIHHLKAVVTEFLDYARRPSPHPEPFRVRPLLEEVAELCAPTTATVRIEAAPELRALADRGQIRRALVNLARNAVAAAGPGGQVVLAASVADGRVRWEVRDSGPGVPDELQDKIFAPFFTTREKGTGLGLAFVRDIARDHGGAVTADRAPEGGARFRLHTALAPTVG
jgi:signal transduction histidine kinase